MDPVGSPTRTGNKLEILQLLAPNLLRVLAGKSLLLGYNRTSLLLIYSPFLDARRSPY